MDDDAKDILHKEIDLIQECVKRMSNNSFLLKGWLMSLIAVAITLLPQKINSNLLILLIIVMTLCFWYLDGYYLKLERMFREKYNWVIKKRPKGNKEYLYNLNPNNKNMWLDHEEKITIMNSMFSYSLLPFYGLIVITSLAILIII